MAHINDSNSYVETEEIKEKKIPLNRIESDFIPIIVILLVYPWN
jgi:hypothetical protein